MRIRERRENISRSKKDTSLRSGITNVGSVHQLYQNPTRQTTVHKIEDDAHKRRLTVT